MLQGERLHEDFWLRAILSHVWREGAEEENFLLMIWRVKQVLNTYLSFIYLKKFVLASFNYKWVIFAMQ